MATLAPRRWSAVLITGAGAGDHRAAEHRGVCEVEAAVDRTTDWRDTVIRMAAAETPR